MAGNNTNYNFSSNISSFTKSMSGFTSTWKNLGKEVGKSTKGFAKAQKEIRKTNEGFRNMTRDANRATGGLNKMGIAIKSIGLYALARGLSSAINSAMDMIETANLFSVALGNLSVETGKVVDEWGKLTGLDVTNMRNAVGTFGALSTSMGMTEKASQQLSTTTYRLGLDLASLFNVNITQALEDMSSGLVGQARVMYKYGIDVTEASLKVEALSRGITKSVRMMSQGEKMALRYAVMLRQSAIVHADFANTIEQPANQLRILKERMVTLSRTVGTVFIPALAFILPYLNAIVQVLTVLISRLAMLFGYDKSVEDVWNVDKAPFSGVGDDVDDLETGLGGATKKAKELKKQLMGFDEINQLSDPAEDSAGAGGGGGFGAPIDLSWLDDLTYDSKFDTIKMRAQEMAESMLADWDELMVATNRLKDSFANLWNQGLRILARASYKAVIGFYENFLKPVTLWVVGNGLPELVDIFNRGLLQIDYARLIKSMNDLWKALTPFAINIGKGLLSFFEKVLVPLGVWSVGVGFPKFLDITTSLVNKIDWEKLLGSLDGLWGAITPFAKNVGNGLLWFYENVLAPISLWAINSLFPTVIDTLTIGIKALGDIVDGIKPTLKWLWEDLLVPLGNWTGELVIEALEWLGEKLTSFGEWISEHNTEVEAIVLTFGALALSVIAVKKAFEAFIAIKAGIVLATQIIGGSFTFLSANPIGILILAIASIITIGLFLIKNWDEIKVIGENVWNSIKEFTSIAIEFVKDKINEDVGIIKDFWGSAWEGIKTTFSEVWNGIKTTFSNIWDGITTGLKNGLGTIKQVWSEAWTSVGNFFIEIANGVISGFEGMLNLVIAGLNKFIGWIKNIPLLGDGLSISLIQSVDLKRLDLLKSKFSNPLNIGKPMMQYAGGGIPNYGEMFIAREAGAELVGGFGGKTGVMNNDQIVEAVSAGVYSAVSSAMSVSGSNSGQSGEVVLEIDGTKLGRILLPKMNNESKRLGYKPILESR